MLFFRGRLRTTNYKNCEHHKIQIKNNKTRTRFDLTNAREMFVLYAVAMALVQFGGTRRINLVYKM